MRRMAFGYQVFTGRSSRMTPTLGSRCPWGSCSRPSRPLGGRIPSDGGWSPPAVRPASRSSRGGSRSAFVLVTASPVPLPYVLVEKQQGNSTPSRVGIDALPEVSGVLLVGLYGF